MKTKLIPCLIALLVGVARPGLAEELSLEAAPPVVVRTEPVAGATQVDPRTSEIRVTYSKSMQDGSWSWSTWGEENFPQIVGEPRYLADGRTCAIKVKLEPGKFYATWLNSDKFKNFRDTAGHPAVPYLLTFRTREHGPASGAGAAMDVSFGVVTETVLKAPEGRVAELLDLDTGRRETSRDFGANDRETHAWVREHRLDVLGVLERGHLAVLCMDTVVVPTASNAFSTITAAAISTNWHLGQGEANKITAISPVQDKTDTWIFRTREDGRGVMQLIGESADPRGVTLRYKMLSPVGGGGRTSSDAQPETASAAFLPALNADQRAVLWWTDRQFKSFFDGRTFAGWSAEERAALERKLIDALSGPRSTEYYQAINSLGAMRSTNALPKLRGIAYERAERNNRDRWMAIRALGLIGDKADVPELIHLVYHGNQNTHWWAQISLVRITGQNFGKDWNAWGQWWNDQNGQPPYKPEIIRWWNGQPEPDKLAAALEESDQKFLAGLNSK